MSFRLVSRTCVLCFKKSIWSWLRRLQKKVSIVQNFKIVLIILIIINYIINLHRHFEFNNLKLFFEIKKTWARTINSTCLCLSLSSVCQSSISIQSCTFFFAMYKKHAFLHMKNRNEHWVLSKLINIWQVI